MSGQTVDPEGELRTRAGRGSRLLRFARVCVWLPLLASILSCGPGSSASPMSSQPDDAALGSANMRRGTPASGGDELTDAPVALASRDGGSPALASSQSPDSGPTVDGAADVGATDGPRGADGQPDAATPASASVEVVYLPPKGVSWDLKNPAVPPYLNAVTAALVSACSAISEGGRCVYSDWVIVPGVAKRIHLEAYGTCHGAVCCPGCSDGRTCQVTWPSPIYTDIPRMGPQDVFVLRYSTNTMACGGGGATCTVCSAAQTCSFLGTCR